MMEILRARAGDEATAIAAIHGLKPAAERAGHDASPGHMLELLARDESYLYIASVDAGPVGFLLAYRVPRVDRDQDMIYLYEIGVLPEHRRRGIGSKMVRLLKEECCSAGRPLRSGREHRKYRHHPGGGERAARRRAGRPSSPFRRLRPTRE